MVLSCIGSLLTIICNPEDYKPKEISEEEKKDLKEKLKNSKLKNLGYPLGYLFTLYQALMFVLTPYILCRYGFTGYMIYIPFRMLIGYIDNNTSNAHSINLLSIRLNGYNPEKVVSSWFINSIEALFVNFIAFYLILPEIEVFSLDLNIILKLTVIAFFTDIYFTKTHKMLHNKYPQLHRLHHTCIYSCSTTNLVFEPVDKYFEFYIPNVIVLIVCLIIKDYPLFLAYNMFHSCVYAIQHDEYIKTHHYYHHRYSDSSYRAYSSAKEYNSSDATKMSLIMEY